MLIIVGIAVKANAPNVDNVQSELAVTANTLWITQLTNS